jgi:hypothetical protein
LRKIGPSPNGLITGNKAAKTATKLASAVDNINILKEAEN